MAYLLSSPCLPQNMLLEQQFLQHQLFSNSWNTLAKNPKYTPFSSRFDRVINPNSVIRNALMKSYDVLPKADEREHEFLLAQKLELEEDPRLLSEIWREIQGENDWEGLIDPMNSHLRLEVLRYGEFAQACYDSFDFDPHSKYCGSCKYTTSEFFDKLEMAHHGYDICRYVISISDNFISMLFVIL